MDKPNTDWQHLSPPTVARSVAALIEQRPDDWEADSYHFRNDTAGSSIWIGNGGLLFHLESPGSASLGFFGKWRVWRAYKRWLRWHFARKLVPKETSGTAVTVAAFDVAALDNFTGQGAADCMEDTCPFCGFSIPKWSVRAERVRAG